MLGAWSHSLAKRLIKLKYMSSITGNSPSTLKKGAATASTSTTNPRGGARAGGAGPRRRKKNQSEKPQHLGSIKMFTSNFESFRKECQAVRYKVHRPNCACPNVKTALAKPIVVVDDPTAESEVVESPAETRIFEEPVDGLVVVPQTRSLRSIYVCDETKEHSFHENPKKAELKLRQEIFPDAKESECTSFKVSCASCLLDYQPNGFACVSSPSTDIVNRARDWAREAATNKSRDQWHADHAHHVVTLPRYALESLNRSKTRGQKQEAQDGLWQLLQNQGVPVEPETQSIAIQHHLSSLLFLTRDQSKKSYQWLVIVFDDTHKINNPCWSLDLAGGKRHLGETAQEAAIRETEEETSLVWNERWIEDVRPHESSGGTRRNKNSSEDCNRYFLLTPPSDWDDNQSKW